MGSGEADLAMQRDKLVLSQFLKIIEQEENPILNVAPNKKTKSSSMKHLRLTKNVHHVSLFGVYLITSIYKRAKENNHHLPLPLPAKPCLAAF